MTTTALASFATGATEAWSRVMPGDARRTRAEMLKGRKERKVVLRLFHGATDVAIIAKRCRLATGLLERAIYDDLLPRVPAPGLRCHGLVRDDDAERCWLFLEDAVGERYEPTREDHRRLAGHWLGLLHTHVAASAVASLPDHAPARHLAALRRCLGACVAHRDNPALSSGDAAVIDALGRELELLAARWDDVVQRCADMPVTLVHGDLGPKNLRVRRDASGSALLCFDWGCAGGGPAAVDLAQPPAGARRFAAAPDLESYWRVAHDAWPWCTLAMVRRWATVGTVFRALAALSWASRSLGSGYPSGAVAEMAVALGVIARFRGAAGELP